MRLEADEPWGGHRGSGPSQEGPSCPPDTEHSSQSPAFSPAHQAPCDWSFVGLCSVLSGWPASPQELSVAPRYSRRMPRPSAPRPVVLEILVLKTKAGPPDGVQRLMEERQALIRSVENTDLGMNGSYWRPARKGLGGLENAVNPRSQIRV